MDDFHGWCGPKHGLMKVLFENMKDYKVPVSNVVTTPRPEWQRPPSTQPEVPTQPGTTTTHDPNLPTVPTVPPTIPPVDCSSPGADFFPHADCNKFYMCLHGQPIEQSCAPGLIWNVGRKVCDWPANADRPECRV